MTGSPSEPAARPDDPAARPDDPAARPDDPAARPDDAGSSDSTPLIVVVGATGTGKSALSLDLADEFLRRGRPAEIVGADAMQLYRGMDIGTAKIPRGERRGIPHHQLDRLDVVDEASVARYQSEARADIDGVVARGAVPILVGGSGLYVSSVIHHYSFPGTDPAIRRRLEAELELHGLAPLLARLAEQDPRAATAIGTTNARRVVRALEVAELTGVPFGSGLPDETAAWRPMVVVGLEAPRATLVQRLDERVERMWAHGLLDEVQALLPLGLERGPTAARAIGYAQALAQVNGRVSRADAVADTQAITRRYARRQVGWFRRYPSVTWLPHDADDLVGSVLALPGVGSIEP
ncbi:MAG: tRNA ((37)-N6)-dimethylallyltransferase MiaA [Actinomycetota bacterium]|jgi:tRNA dimethylallyltransferase